MCRAGGREHFVLIDTYVELRSYAGNKGAIHHNINKGLLDVEGHWGYLHPRLIIEPAVVDPMRSFPLSPSALQLVRCHCRGELDIDHYSGIARSRAKLSMIT